MAGSIFARRTAVMAVLNVTPDSFFDGGRHFDTGRAIADGLAMAQAGADIIDIGGESSRPAAAPVAASRGARPRASGDPRFAPAVRAADLHR